MTVQTPIQEKAELEAIFPQADGYSAVLANKSFLALWIGQVLSQLADRIIFVVFIAFVVNHFGPSDRYTSFLYIAFTIPAIFLTAVAGVFVDRWPRRGVLVTTNLLRFLFVMLLPWAAQGNAWAIYLSAFLISTVTQFFVPAEAATIPVIVHKNQLITANSLFTTTMMASVILGFALGDPLINIFSLSQVHWAIAGLFLTSSIALMFLPPIPRCVMSDCAPTGQAIRSEFQKFIDEMSVGINYIRENRMVLNAMLKLAMLFSSMVALCILFISFAKAYLYEDPLVAAQKFAYIVAFSGIGMALGAFLVGNPFRNARRGAMVFGGFSVLGACLLLLTAVALITKNQYLFHLPRFVSEFIYLDEVRLTVRMLYTYTLATLMGVAAAFIAIPLQALLHELIPEDKRGKVLGVQFTILSTSSTLPVLIAGLAVEWLGVQWMFWLIGLPLLTLGIIGLYQWGRTKDGLAANW